MHMTDTHLPEMLSILRAFDTIIVLSPADRYHMDFTSAGMTVVAQSDQPSFVTTLPRC